MQTEQYKSQPIPDKNEHV